MKKTKAKPVRRETMKKNEKESTREIIVQQQPPAPLMEMSVEMVTSQLEKIDQVINAVMKEGIHYGKVPGVEKSFLFQAGAQVLNRAFRLLPRFDVRVIDLPNNHRDYQVTCTIEDPLGRFLGSGEGSASTMEGKYRFRMADIECPKCHKPNIRKSKQDDGWYCWAKTGGCGATFPKGDASIEKQHRGQVENPDIATQWNTCYKMGCKRALVAATINVLAVSDRFTQDEDAVEARHDTQAEVAGNGKAAPAQNGNGTAARPEAPRPVAMNGDKTLASSLQMSKILREASDAGVDWQVEADSLKIDYTTLYKKDASKLIEHLMQMKR